MFSLFQLGCLDFVYVVDGLRGFLFLVLTDNWIFIERKILSQDELGSRWLYTDNLLF